MSKMLGAMTKSISGPFERPEAALCWGERRSLRSVEAARKGSQKSVFVESQKKGGGPGVEG